MNNMTEKEVDEALQDIILRMIDVCINGGKHIEETPISTIFLGLSTAIISTGSIDDKLYDEDVTKSSVALLLAIESVVKSSQLLKEIDIQNQINDLTK